MMYSRDQYLLKSIAVLAIFMCTSACTSSSLGSIDGDKPHSQDYSTRRMPRDNSFIEKGGYNTTAKQDPFATGGTVPAAQPAGRVRLPSDSDYYYYDEPAPETLLDLIRAKNRSKKPGDTSPGTIQEWLYPSSTSVNAATPDAQQQDAPSTIQEWLHSSSSQSTSSETTQQAEQSNQASFFGWLTPKDWNTTDGAVSSGVQYDSIQSGEYSLLPNEGGDLPVTQPTRSGTRRMPSGNIKELAANPAEGSGEDGSYIGYINTAPVASVVTEHTAGGHSSRILQSDKVRTIRKAINPTEKYKEHSTSSLQANEVGPAVTLHKAVKIVRSAVRRYGLDGIDITGFIPR